MTTTDQPTICLPDEHNQCNSKDYKPSDFKRLDTGHKPIDYQTVSVSLREKQAAAPINVDVGIYIIPPATIWFSLLVVLLGIIGFFAPKVKWVRELMLAIVDESGDSPGKMVRFLVWWISVNDKYRMALLKDAMPRTEPGWKPDKKDEEAIEAAKNTSNVKTGFVVYYCPENEFAQRSLELSMCLAQIALNGNQIWRFPVAIDLRSITGGLDEAVRESLQQHGLNNQTFVKYLLRSGDVAFILYGLSSISENLKANIRQIVSYQSFRAICLLETGPCPFGDQAKTVNRGR